MKSSTQRFLILVGLSSLLGCVTTPSTPIVTSPEQHCIEVSLTGTMGGPANYKGLAGSGTLVKFGTVANNCGDVHLQFDTGRATSVRLAELGVDVKDLDAVFITHLHSDHTVGLVDILQTRWHFFGKPLDLVCSADHATPEPHSRIMSCESFAMHIADASERAGEIAQRSAESKNRSSLGPSTMANYVGVPAPLPNTPTVVWESGNVKVSAIGSRHIPGHLSYRVDTPAGSVVVGGDAGNDLPAPPRNNSTSANVELLANGADVVVHSTIHPRFAPTHEPASKFPGPIYYRQSTAEDLGAMAERAGVKNLIMTHLIPAIGAEFHGVYEVPYGPLSADDYEDAARASGYQGKIHVGRDLMTIRLLEE